MEKRITSLLLANNPGNELVRRVKELEDKIKWLQHNSRNMDNYLELEPFSKDSELCGYVCDTLKALPEVPTIATCKDYKAIVILLGILPRITKYWMNWRNSTATRTIYPNCWRTAMRCTGCDRGGNTCATYIIRCVTLSIACACIL